MSRQGNRDSTVCSTPASSVDTWLCELLSVLLWLLVCDVGQETQCDWIPLLWQQQEQEAQADDAGGCQAHHAEDHLVLQDVHGCSRWKKQTGANKGAKVDSEGGWRRNKNKLITSRGINLGVLRLKRMSAANAAYYQNNDPPYPLCLVSLVSPWHPDPPSVRE